MKKREIFGTDGIRGKANVFPMTVEIALALGKGLAWLIKENKMGKSSNGVSRLVVIGKDTRISGYCFEQAVSAGLCSMGVDVVLVGPLPTPGIAHLTKQLNADAGVVVSASHNPFCDNGIKIFDHDGFKLPDSTELELESLIFSQTEMLASSLNNEVGKVTRNEKAAECYVDYLKSTLPSDFTLLGMKIVVDCAHGAAYKVAPEVLRQLGATVTVIGDKPDGTNINHEVGSLFPDQARKEILNTQSDVGLVLDGDADRILVIDEKGDVLPGEILLTLLAQFLKEEGKLKNNVLVTTDMSNLGLDNYLNSVGVNVERVQVGDRYVVERMRQKGHSFGGEESGHIICLDRGTTGDGLVGGLLLLSILCKRKATLSEISKPFKLIPRVVKNVQVKNKIPLEKLTHTSTLMGQIRETLNSKGRLFVRYSGTEQKARILVEGPSEFAIHKMADDLALQLESEVI